MKKMLSMFLLIGLLMLIACDQATTRGADKETLNKESADGKVEEVDEWAADEDSSSEEKEVQLPDTKISSSSSKKDPKTVMDFFALLPEKYFTLEGCFRDSDKDCKKARAEYLKNYKEVEDIKNGYFKAGCDGGQSCIEMALFKRPDKTYVVAVATFSEAMEDNYFLDYKDGVWTDISSTVVPEFSKDKVYEIPRYGTTMKVYSTKLIEKDGDFEIREKVENIYDLEWKNGKFVKK